MDLKNIWDKASNNDDDLNKIFEQKDLNSIQSKLPLYKLKRNLMVGMIWAILITAAYIVVLFYFPIWQVFVTFGILCIFNIIIAADSWKLYKNLEPNIPEENSLKQELQRNYTGFKRWWRIQEKLGLFVYPIAATGGFIIGGIVGSGKSAEAFLYNPRIILLLVITVIILVPICYYGARWMFNYAYGKHLKQIKDTIDQLS